MLKGDNMPLFAIMDNTASNRILRIDTDKQTDVKIIKIFQDQYSLFESHHNTILPFYAGYTPTYSECFLIDPFPDAALLEDALKRSTAIPVWVPNKDPIDKIKGLFVGVQYPSNTSNIAIQVFTKAQILDFSKSLWMSNNVFTMASSIGFNISDKLVATIQSKKIKFKSFLRLRGIFDMDPYFKEATDQDLDIFINSKSFDVPSGFELIPIADTVIRTKIALISKSGILDNHTIKELKIAAKKVNFNLKTIIDGGIEKIALPDTKKEIKTLLTFLDEDIFVAEISKKRFRSNSKRPI